jgi:hypothetical protein
LAIRALSESRDYKINWSRLATIGDPSDEHRHTTRARSRRPDYPSAESTPSSSVPVAVLRSTARRCPPPSRGRPTLHVGIIRHRADDLDDCFQYQLLRYVAGDTSRRSRFFVLCHRYRLIGVGSRHRRSAPCRSQNTKRGLNRALGRNVLEPGCLSLGYIVWGSDELRGENVPDGAWRAARPRRNPIHGTHCYLAGTA